MEEVIVGLDIGTSKTCCVIALIGETGQLRVVGMGLCSSEGVRGGVIMSMKAATKAVQVAVEKAEIDSKGYEVRGVLVSITGGSVKGINSRGVVGVAHPNEITQGDVDRVIDSAKALAISLDREFLHVIPQEYVVDDVPKIKNPLEMMGIRLEANVHLILGSVSATRGLVSCVNSAGFLVTEVVLESLASSASVLSEEEREVGVLLIDFGGGTTDAVLYIDGAPHHTQVIPIGSDRVTKDLAQVLQIPDEDAEQIKVIQGACWEPILSDPEEEVIIRSVGSRPAHTIARREVCHIIQARVDEILNLVYKEVHQAGYLTRLGGGIVLTGGGANLAGITDLVREIFGKDVRVGFPQQMEGLNVNHYQPEYTAALGLVKLGGDKIKSQITYQPNRQKGSAKKEGIWSRFQNWFKKNWI